MVCLSEVERVSFYHNQIIAYENRSCRNIDFRVRDGEGKLYPPPLKDVHSQKGKSGYLG